MHSKMDVPKKSKRLIIWNGGSISERISTTSEGFKTHSCMQCAMSIGIGPRPGATTFYLGLGKQS